MGKKAIRSIARILQSGAFGKVEAKERENQGW